MGVEAGTVVVNDPDIVSLAGPAVHDRQLLPQQEPMQQSAGKCCTHCPAFLNVQVEWLCVWYTTTNYGSPHVWTTDRWDQKGDIPTWTCWYISHHLCREQQQGHKVRHMSACVCDHQQGEQNCQHQRHAPYNTDYPCGVEDTHLRRFCEGHQTWRCWLQLHGMELISKGKFVGDCP